MPIDHPFFYPGGPAFTLSPRAAMVEFSLAIKHCFPVVDNLDRL